MGNTGILHPRNIKRYRSAVGGFGWEIQASYISGRYLVWGQCGGFGWEIQASYIKRWFWLGNTGILHLKGISVNHIDRWFWLGNTGILHHTGGGFGWEIQASYISFAVSCLTVSRCTVSAAAISR